MRRSVGRDLSRLENLESEEQGVRDVGVAVGRERVELLAHRGLISIGHGETRGDELGVVAELDEREAMMRLQAVEHVLDGGEHVSELVVVTHREARVDDDHKVDRQRRSIVETLGRRGLVDREVGERPHRGDTRMWE